MLQLCEHKESTVGADADDLLTPKQAAAFLAGLWRRPFTVKDFANMRNNALAKAKAQGVPLLTLFPIEPAFSDIRITLWRRRDLKRLAEDMEPPRIRYEVRKPRPKRRKLES